MTYSGQGFIMPMYVSREEIEYKVVRLTVTCL